MVVDYEEYSKHVKGGKRKSSSVDKDGVLKTRISVNLDIIYNIKNPKFCHQRAPADDIDDWEIDRSKDKPFDGCPYYGYNFCHLFFRELKSKKRDYYWSFRCKECLEVAGLPTEEDEAMYNLKILRQS